MKLPKRDEAAPEDAPDVTWALRVETSRLVIREPGGASTSHGLDGRPVGLGRAADNGLVVHAEFVADHQIRFEPTGLGDSYRAVDLGGGCGLWSGGERIRERVLRHGDVLRLVDAFTGGFVTIAYQRLARTVVPAGEQAPRRALGDGEVAIGREGCDVVLPSILVSRRHAVVRSLPGGGHEVRDQGSANGTFVNGQRVQARRLSAGDVIQVGAFRLLYDGTSLASHDPRQAFELQAHGLSRTVAGGRTILRDVSLAIQPREFVAIVGESGSGKSTLLGALSGFARATEGRLLVNGDDFYGHFDVYRGSIGYVPQSDILHRSLSVEEALRFTAQLRLPADAGEAELALRVERVLVDVDMEAHRTKTISQLSGGQRKRVSIAAELLADPGLFFLDEPTSGLDPGLEKRLMYTLRRLADGGRTIVIVTHATANIDQCDHIAFMADGRLVWFGPPAEALRHFGVRDFADIYTRLQGEAGPDHPLSTGVLREELAGWRASHPQGEPTLAELWELRYRASDTRTRLVEERLVAAPGAARKAEAVSGDMSSEAPASGLRQFGILLRRNLRLLEADRRNLLIMALQAPIIGGVLVLVARAEALQEVALAHARLVLFLVALVAVWFGILCSARELTKERDVYRRERLANLRIGPYLLAKLVVLAVVCMVQSVVLLAVLALDVDVSAAVTTFTASGPVAVVRGVGPLGFVGALLVTTFLSSFAGLGLGLLISAASRTSDRAMSLVPMVLVPQLLLALALVPLPAGMAPLSWLMGARWAMEAFGAIAHLTPPRDFSACTIPGNPLSCPVYPTVDYDPATSHVLWVWGVLVAQAAVCLAIAGWVLARRGDER